jgi:hypothetical protein
VTILSEYGENNRVVVIDDEVSSGIDDDAGRQGAEPLWTTPRY